MKWFLAVIAALSLLVYGGCSSSKANLRAPEPDPCWIADLPPVPAEEGVDGRLVEFDPIVGEDPAQWRGPFPGYLLDDAAAAAWESTTRDAQARFSQCGTAIVANRLRCTASVGYRDQQAADLRAALQDAQGKRLWWIAAAAGEAILLLSFGALAVAL